MRVKAGMPCGVKAALSMRFHLFSFNTQFASNKATFLITKYNKKQRGQLEIR